MDSLRIMGPEQAMFEEFADIKHGEGRQNCMSIEGLRKALHEMHADKSGAELTLSFKVADLNGDGEIDIDEFLFAVKIRHGAGFEKGQYFITFETEEPLSVEQQDALVALFKTLKHPLECHLEEVVMFGRTESARSHLSFQGKHIETGESIIPGFMRQPSVGRMPSDQSSLNGFTPRRIPSENLEAVTE